MMSLFGETSSRARKFEFALSGWYQLTLNLPSFQFAFGTLSSESREPLLLPIFVRLTEHRFHNTLGYIFRGYSPA